MSVSGKCYKPRVCKMADENIEQGRIFIVRKIVRGTRRRRLTIQQYTLQYVQQRHRLILQHFLVK